MGLIAAVACVWLVWGDITVQALIDHNKHDKWLSALSESDKGVGCIVMCTFTHNGSLINYRLKLQRT